MNAVLILLVVAIVLVALSRRESGPAARVRPSGRASLADVLGRAAAAGVITGEQAAAVLALEAGPAPAGAGERPAARVPPVLEALGYLGAVFVIVGAATLVSRFWGDLETWSRLAILGGVSAALTAAGLSLRDETEPVLWRLCGILLLLGSGALAGFAALLAVDALDLGDEPVGMLTGGAVAVHSGALWWRKDRPAQHAACLAGLLATVVAGVNWMGGEEAAVGLALWALGAAWLLAAFRRLLPPAVAGIVLGGALTLIGAGVTGGQWERIGVVFGLATAAAMVAGGIRTGEFIVTALGVIGSFFYLPATVATFFGETIGVPAVMLVSGLALLALTVRLMQHGGGSGAAPPAPPTPSRPARPRPA